jgi:hypothetical protein
MKQRSSYVVKIMRCLQGTFEEDAVVRLNPLSMRLGMVLNGGNSETGIVKQIECFYSELHSFYETGACAQEKPNWPGILEYL